MNQKILFNNNIHNQLMMSSTNLINRIINQCDQYGALLVQKYNLQSLILMLDRSKIESIEKIYNIRPDGLNIIEFSRFFLNFIPHSQNQTLYLVMGLIDFFREIISMTHNPLNRIRFIDITNYLCGTILQKRNSQNDVSTKYVPDHKMINPVYKIRDYLINPPVIYGNQTQITYKLSQNKMCIDKGKHQSLINRSCFSSTQQKIFCLQSLSDCITVYDPECQIVEKIKPNSSKIKKDSVVLNFAYSQKEERIGAVLKDFSLSFWDLSDNCKFQKSISTATASCQQLQINIWYLNYFQKWVTSDRFGVISIWNIYEQIQQRTLICISKTKINDLCQIPSLNLIAIVQQNKNKKGVQNPKDIVYETSKIGLYNFVKGKYVTEIDTHLERRILHTICYSQTYQVLLSAGYEKKINIFQINHKYLDSSLKGQLLGHESIITSFSLVRQSPMVISADDKGKVKIWNIKNYKCMQTLDFSDKIIITQVIDMIEVGKIGVIGSRISFLEFDEKEEIKKKYQIEKTNPILQFQCNKEKKELLVLTKTDIRIYDMQNGRLKVIYCEYHAFNQDVNLFLYIQENKQIITANQKGQLSVFCSKSGKLKQKQMFHTATILHLEYDSTNRLLVTCGCDSSINILKKVNEKWEIIRQIKNNFGGKQITCFCLSVYHNMIAVGNTNLVYLWDYEFAKILIEVQLPQGEEATSLQIMNGFQILLIGTANGSLYALEINNAQFKTEIKQVWSYRSMLHQKHILSINIDKKMSLQLKNEENRHCYSVYLTFETGITEMIDISQSIQDIKQKKTRNNTQMYNASRQLKQNFNTQYKKNQFNYFKIKGQIPHVQFDVNEIKPFTTGFSYCNIVEFDEHFFVITNSDGRLKLWAKDQLKADLNINLLLPYKWHVNTEYKKGLISKISYGLKLIKLIFQKFGKDISIGESKTLKMESLLKYYTQQGYLTEIKQERDDIILFQNQFSVEDVHYKKIKQFNFSDVGGQSLKKMQFNKKLDNLHREWQTNKTKQDQERSQLLEKLHYKVQKNQQKQSIINLLKQKTVPFQHKEKYEQNQYLRSLNQKMEESIKPKNMKHENNINLNAYLGTKDSFLSRFNWTRSKKIENEDIKQKNKTYFQKYFNQKSTVSSPIQTPAVKKKWTPRHSRKTVSQLYNQAQKTTHTALKQIKIQPILKQMHNQLQNSKRQLKGMFKQKRMLKSIKNNIDQNQTQSNTMSQLIRPSKKKLTKFQRSIIEKLDSNINHFVASQTIK